VVAVAIGAAVLASGVDLTVPANAAEKEWKMHAVWVPKRPEIGWMQNYFVDPANERLKGKLKITLYPGGSLGVKDVDMLRILPPGNVIQLTALYAGYMSRDVPEMAHLLPAGVVQEPETLVKIYPTLKEIYQGVYDKWDIKLLGFVSHPVNKISIFCKDPVRTLDELQKRKLRVWEKFHADTFAALGVSAQVIPQNDLYVAMRQGVVDCAVYPVAFAPTISLQEVATNASYLFPYVLHPIGIIVSNQAWKSLSADEQTALQDTVSEMEKTTSEFYLNGKWEKEQEAGIKADILEAFPKADQDKFTEVARETWRKLATGAGDQAKANYEKVLAAIKAASGG
jgi:TRAP-type C4-dicarboxylate transport system substrate-binding protein